MVLQYYEEYNLDTCVLVHKHMTISIDGATHNITGKNTLGCYLHEHLAGSEYYWFGNSFHIALDKDMFLEIDPENRKAFLNDMDVFK